MSAVKVIVVKRKAEYSFGVFVFRMLLSVIYKFDES